MGDVTAAGEPLFTAAEVQVAIEAVILYERARAERQLRVASSQITEAMRANRRDIKPSRHMTLDEIIGNLSDA